MRVLVIKMSSLGDVVHTLPAVSDLVAQGDQVDWVVEEAFAPIARAHPGVRRVLPIAWRRWRSAMRWLITPAAGQARRELRDFRRALTATDYDLVIDAQGLFKSAMVTRWARAPTKVGFDAHSVRERGAARFYTEGVAVAVKEHAVDRLRRLFAVAAGYTIPAKLDFGLAAAEPASTEPVALLLHGTSWSSKHYPEAHWHTLAAEARAAGYRVVLTWGDDGERARARRIASTAADEVWDRMSLDRLLERLRTVKLVIGLDSGLAHLAAALGVPTLGLYGASDPARTGLRGSAARGLAVGFDCSPCLSRACAYQGAPVLIAGQAATPACLAALAPQAVWRAATELVAAR